MSLWWPNRILPGIVAVFAARLIYITFAQGPYSVLIVFGLVVGGFPTLYFLSVHAVGFLYGFLEREVAERTRWFDVGWQAGAAKTGRARE